MTTRTKDPLLTQFHRLVAHELATGSAGFTSICALSKAANANRGYFYKVLAGEQQPSVQWMQNVLATLGYTLTIKKTSE